MTLKSPALRLNKSTHQLTLLKINFSLISIDDLIFFSAHFIHSQTPWNLCVQNNYQKIVRECTHTKRILFVSFKSFSFFKAIFIYCFDESLMEQCYSQWNSSHVSVYAYICMYIFHIICIFIYIYMNSHGINLCLLSLFETTNFFLSFSRERERKKRKEKLTHFY